MANIKNLDLNLLRVFDTLMDEKNVSRAAEKLSVSQPAVSGMMTRLRHSLADQLFIRSQPWHCANHSCTRAIGTNKKAA